MDSDFTNKLRTGEFWWLDVILYFVLFLLIALIVSSFLLNIKISSQEDYLLVIEKTISEAGTPQQKELEEKVFYYQDKIDDFAVLLESHKIPSNVFSFMEEFTLPDVWFFNFSFNVNDASIRLNGESKNMLILARQIDAFQESEKITKVNVLSANISERGKIDFSLGISFNSDILNIYEN